VLFANLLAERPYSGTSAIEQCHKLPVIVRTYKSRIRLIALARNMRNVADVLFQKEIELARVKKELEALKVSALLLEEQAAQADEPLTLSTFSLALDRCLSIHRSSCTDSTP
jgi:hypothetical protein